MFPGSASVAKGLTMYLDSLCNNQLSSTFKEIAPIYDTSFTSDYFDLFSFGITLLLGSKCSITLFQRFYITFF